MDGTSFLRWDDTPRYEPGFRIGSEGENGEHQRSIDGWPYSIYRQAAEIGVYDYVICHGIQNMGDARQILDRLQCLA